MHEVGQPIFDRDGRTIQTVGTLQDITERKHGEAALRRSEQRFRTLYESNPSMFFTIDGDGTILSVNDFGAAQLGYSVDELVGSAWRDLHEHDDRPKLKIDGMFVTDIVDDLIDRAMVKSINEIGQVMGKRTIAEFVENERVLEELAVIGVDYAQGYGIDRPKPLNDASEFSEAV